jgi:hypothetical protein
MSVHPSGISFRHLLQGTYILYKYMCRYVYTYYSIQEPGWDDLKLCKAGAGHLCSMFGKFRDVIKEERFMETFMRQAHGSKAS